MLLRCRAVAFNQLPECGAVIGMAQVAQLVDDDVIQRFQGCHQQQAVETDQAARVATAPAALVGANF